jgi:hypothetical protein
MEIDDESPAVKFDHKSNKIISNSECLGGFAPSTPPTSVSALSVLARTIRTGKFSRVGLPEVSLD